MMIRFYLYGVILYIVTYAMLCVRFKMVCEGSIWSKDKQDVLIFIGLLLTPVVNIIVSAGNIFLTFLSEENFIKFLDGELY